MKSAGTLLSLQICPGHRKPMQPVDEAEVLANLGLKGDMHALPDSSRQVLLIEKETLDDFQLTPGLVKENITTQGVVLRTLRRGAKLALGSEVILEVTQSCTPCKRMDEIRPGLRAEIAGKRGMLARVIRGGTIKRGDTIEVL